MLWYTNTMGFVITNVYIFMLALVLAVLEIQIEGADGWAKKLPTWRPPESHWFAHWYQKLMSGKELTGYHVAMFGFVFLIFHFPYVWGVPLTLVSWLHTLSFYFMFIVVWDFLWFVLNPHHPISRFATTENPVHKKWFGPLPVDYYGSTVLSFLVLLPLWMQDTYSVAQWWVENMTLFMAQTLVVIWFSLKVLKIDTWVLKENK